MDILVGGQAQEGGEKMNIEITERERQLMLGALKGTMSLFKAIFSPDSKTTVEKQKQAAQELGELEVLKHKISEAR